MALFAGAQMPIATAAYPSRRPRTIPHATGEHRQPRRIVITPRQRGEPRLAAATPSLFAGASTLIARPGLLSGRPRKVHLATDEHGRLSRIAITPRQGGEAPLAAATRRLFAGASTLIARPGFPGGRPRKIHLATDEHGRLRRIAITSRQRDEAPVAAAPMGLFAGGRMRIAHAALPGRRPREIRLATGEHGRPSRIAIRPRRRGEAPLATLSLFADASKLIARSGFPGGRPRKIHLATDEHGRLRRIAVMPGRRGETPLVPAPMGPFASPRSLIADR